MTADLVTARDIIRVASESGIHCTEATVRHAVHTHALVPAQVSPWRFTRDAANRWLTEMWHQVQP